MGGRFTQSLHADQGYSHRTISEQFETVLEDLKTAVEKQALKKESGSYNSLAMFYQSISTASNHFEKIEQSLSTGALANQKKIHANFENLCTTIVKIDKTPYKASNMRPRHIRWLANCISQLGKAATALRNKRLNQADLNLINTIINFAKTMVFYVLQPCSRYIGTGFEQAQDLLVHRPYEFLTRNWWWAIPATAAGAKLVWDASSFAKNQKQDPRDWDLNANVQPECSWYKRLVSVVAGSVLATKFSDGYIKMDGYIPVGFPVGLEKAAETHGAEYEQYEQQFERDSNGSVIGDPKQVKIASHNFQRNYLRRVITQIPALRQSGLDCGFHSLYNAVCLATENYAGLVNRTTFNERLLEWKTLLRQQNALAQARGATTFIGVDQMETIIQGSEYFVPVRRNQQQLLNQDGENPIYNYLNDNISIIFDLNGLEAIFSRNPAENRDILLAGDNNHVLHNIRQFRQDPVRHGRQVIVVNDGYMRNGYAHGAHWFAMVIKHNSDNQTDSIQITDSIGSDYRKRSIINRVYRLFRTDRNNQDLPGM